MNRRLLAALLLAACSPSVREDPDVGTSSATTAIGSTSGSSAFGEVGGASAGATTEGEGGGSSSGAGTTGATAHCSCLDVDGDEPTITCALERLCPPIELDCTRPEQFYGCHFMEREVVNPDALQCAIEAAASGALGYFETLDPGAYPSPGAPTLETRYSLLGDNAALLTETDVLLGERSQLALLPRAAAPTTYFQACSESPSEAARLQCLQEGFTAVEVPCLMR